MSVHLVGMSSEACPPNVFIQGFLMACFLFSAGDFLGGNTLINRVSQGFCN